MKIPERQAELDTLIAEYFSPREGDGLGSGGQLLSSPALTDDEILLLAEKARNAPKFKRLFYEGDTSEHDHDHNRADQALVGMFAFYTQDEDQIDRLFRRSALYRPEKWGRRPDYRKRTIKKVLDGLKEIYKPASSGAKRQEKPSQGEEENCAMSRGDEVNKKFKELVSSDGERPAGMPFNTTDLGNAERLASRHGEDLRYVHAWGKWLEYDETRWRMDDTGGIGRRAKETARSIYGEAEKPEYAELRTKLAKHAIKTEARSRIEAMIVLASSEEGIPVRPEDLDADPWLLNVENGTIDLRTGQLREHRREDLITKIAPVKYEADAEAPTWQAVLERLLPSAELRSFFQRFVGYCLTGDTSEQVMVFLHGLGANGKSTIINALLDTLGDYGRQAAPELLTVKQGNSHPTELADLKGARLVASVEVEEGKRLAESLVKQLTGGDRIKARRMREDFWEFEATHKLLLAANHKPVVRGADHAIWRRIKLVPFEVTIPDDEKDKKLPEKLRAERAGILAWAVRGCLDWQENGLGEPEEVRAATEAYRAEMDVLAAFMEERCVLHEDAHAGATPLYEAYKEWCATAGENHETQTRFGTMLRERGFAAGKHSKTRRKVWYGIGLLSDTGVVDKDVPTLETPPTIGPGPKQSKQPETVETISPREEQKTPGEQNNCFAPPTTVSQDAKDATDAPLDAGKEPGDEPASSARSECSEPLEPATADDPLEAFLSDPPEWFKVQGAGCVRVGLPERLLNPLANAVSTELYGSPWRWREVLPGVKNWLRRQGGGS